MGSHCGDVPAVCGQILHDFMAHCLVVCTVLGQLLCCGAFSPHWLWQRCSRSGIPTVRVPSASLWRHSVTWHGSGGGAVLTGACLSLVTAVLLARFAFNVFVAPSFHRGLTDDFVEAASPHCGSTWMPAVCRSYASWRRFPTAALAVNFFVPLYIFVLSFVFGCGCLFCGAV